MYGQLEKDVYTEDELDYLTLQESLRLQLKESHRINLELKEKDLIIEQLRRQEDELKQELNKKDVINQSLSQTNNDSMCELEFVRDLFNINSLSSEERENVLTKKFEEAAAEKEKTISKLKEAEVEKNKSISKAQMAEVEKKRAISKLEEAEAEKKKAISMFETYRSIARGRLEEINNAKKKLEIAMNFMANRAEELRTCSNYFSDDKIKSCKALVALFKECKADDFLKEPNENHLSVTFDRLKHQ